MGGQQVRDADDDGFGSGALQGFHSALGAEGIAHETDEDCQAHGDDHPYGANPAGDLQLLFVFNGHEPQQDVGHTEVAQAPGQGGNHGEGAVRRGTGTGVGLGEGQEPGQGFGVFHNGAEPAGLGGGKNQNEENGNGHDDALNQIGEGGRKEAAGGGVADNHDGGDDHGGHVVHTEQGGKQLATGGEAGSGVGDEEHNDNEGGNGGQNALAVLEPLGEELGQGVGPGDLGIPAQTAGGEQPVEIGAGSQTDGGPAHIGHAGEVGKSGQTHQQVAGHIGGLGAHGGDQGAQFPSAQVEVRGGGILFGVVGADPKHTG